MSMGDSRSARRTGAAHYTTGLPEHYCQGDDRAYDCQKSDHRTAHHHHLPPRTGNPRTFAGPGHYSTGPDFPNAA